MLTHRINMHSTGIAPARIAQTDDIWKITKKRGRSHKLLVVWEHQLDPLWETSTQAWLTQAYKEGICPTWYLTDYWGCSPQISGLF